MQINDLKAQKAQFEEKIVVAKERLHNATQGEELLNLAGQVEVRNRSHITESRW